MEFLESVKSQFEKYYKANRLLNTRQAKVEKLICIRRETRSQVLDERRNVNEFGCSAVELKKPSASVQPKPKMNRLERLKQWKIEKEKKMKTEKEKKKPTFKVGARQNVGFPELKSETNTSKTIVKNAQKSFAPKNHVFCAPKNVKSINMNFREELTKNSNTTNNFQRITRSQKPVASPPLPLPTKKKKTVLKERNVNKAKNTTKSQDDNLLTEPEKNIKTKNPNRLHRQDAIEETSIIQNDTKTRTSKRKSLTKKNLTSEIKDIDEENKVPAIKKKCTNENTPKNRQSVRKSLRKSTLVEKKLNSTFELVDCTENNVPKSSSGSSGMSTSYSMSDDAKNSPLEDDVFVYQSSENDVKTPEHNQQVSAYISPFVTTSRGKGSMKKENRERSIRGLPSFTEYNAPDTDANSSFQVTGAAYFHNILNNEISRLESMCSAWEEYKNSETLTEDATDLIDVAVGQANLLIRKKFQQFRGLIVSCQNGHGEEKPVTCEDLQGFWDMVYMQVENLTSRFTRLAELRDNNWEEIIPVVETKIKKRRIQTKKASTTSTSSIRAAILAARKRSVQSKSENEAVQETTQSVFNGGFFVVKSPHKKTPKEKTTENTPSRTRRSLLVSVLSTETNKRVQTSVRSPGVTMMKASQLAKSVENLAESFTFPTPGKSILKKSKSRKSVANTSKAVLFKDDEDED